MSKNTSLSELINYVSSNSSGNVTIAAPSSGYALDVAGTGRFTGALASTNFILSGGTGNTGLYYGHTDRVVLANYTAGGIDFETNGGTINMTLFPSGNLGVGASLTDDGSNKLQVSGSGKFTSSVTATQYTATSTGGSGLRVYGASGTNQWDIYLNSTNLRFSDNTGTGSVVFDRPLSGTSATFSGSVGIGTSPSYKLHLLGGNEVGSRFIVTGTYAPIQFSGDNGTTLGGVNAFNGDVYIGRGTSTGTQGDLKISSTGAATFSSSVTANSTSGVSGTFTSSTFFGSIDLENTGGTATGKWNVQAVSGAQIGGSAGSSFGIYSYGASAYRMFINSSGNVGIGNTTANSRLYVEGSVATNGISIKSGGNGGTYPFRVTWNGGTEGDMLCVDDNGRLGIGTTSPSRLFHVYANTSTTTPLVKFENVGTGDAVTEYRINGYSWYVGIDNSDSGAFKIGQDPLGTSDRFILKDGGYALFSGLRIKGSDTANTIYNANSNMAITCEAGYAISIGRSSDTTKSLNVSTTNGDTAIGRALENGVKLSIQSATTGSDGYAIIIRNSTPADLFVVRNDGLYITGTRGASPYNNTTGSGANMVVASDGVLYRSTSSIKYKKNVLDYSKGLAEIMQMRAVTYEGKSKADEGKIFAGLIAEEVHDLGLTEFVQYAEDGTPDALAYQNMVSLLIKGIQEQQFQIEELKQLINN